MRGNARPRGPLVLTAALAVLAFSAPAAQADTGDVVEPQHDPPSAQDGFQAGTCISDTPVKCSPETPELFYKEAGGHPPIAFTQYFVKHKTIVEGMLEETESVPKTIRVDLPVGLTVNPQATPQCELAVFKANEAGCPPGSIVGREEVTVSVQVGGVIEFPPGSGMFLPKNAVLPPNPLLNTLVPIYNLVPREGEPALFGFKIGTSKSEVYLEGDVAWESDYHPGFTIRLPAPNPLVHTLKSRLVSFGRSGENGNYITNPTTCFNPDEPPFLHTYSTFLRADSVELPDPDFPNGQTPWEAALPEGVQLEGCDEVPFQPSLDVAAGTDLVDSPAAPTVIVTLPFKPQSDEREQSHLRNAEIILPAGMGLNPSAANGLEACSDAQFGKGTRNDIACHPASKIGTAEVETPPLPPGSLKGDVYLGQQLSRDPASGQMYRIFVPAESKRYGISARLIGNVSADPNTGQLTTTFAENPQVPFESVKLQFDKAKGVLTSPPICGPHKTTSTMEPWSTLASTTTPFDSFDLTTAPGGGPCPQTLAERPFNPGYSAGPRERKAGAFSPFELRIQRPDGAQELRRIDVKLPPGMVAKLRGLEYCSEENIAAASNRSGTSEVAEPSCPVSSFVGTAGIDAGSGPAPLHVDGNVYLAGAYKGAPVSLVFLTPAVAGPFDLGTVVVRVALYVDPETAQVNAVSDTIPDVFGGVKLDIRAIGVSINRQRFTVNPTTCRESFLIASDIFGGGANPANLANWFTSMQGSFFRATDCRALRFKPKFFTRIFGGRNQTQRAKNPKFRAILDARKGDANVRRAALVLPRATILDQSHIRTVCTRAELASRSCPKEAIYGYARAKSPLLNGVLKGPVYLVSSDDLLPNLLADLRGQVDIRLRGVISATRGRLKTVFFPTPDVAVDKFTLVMRGGNRGLLVNSENLCARQRFSFLNLRAQNSRQLKTARHPLNVPACGG